MRGGGQGRADAEPAAETGRTVDARQQSGVAFSVADFVCGGGQQAAVLESVYQVVRIHVLNGLLLYNFSRTTVLFYILD